MNFPYISQIIVHDCYTYQGLNIPKIPLTEFKHIIITGKNGSGKTTILNRISLMLKLIQEGKSREQEIGGLESSIKFIKTHPNRSSWEEQLKDLQGLDLKFLDNNVEGFSEEAEPYIISFFRANRKVEVADVKSVTKEDDFLLTLKQKSNPEVFTKLFKQYLVNKKIYEAFDHMNNKLERKNQNKMFFDSLRDTLRNILEDNKLELEFIQENFEFNITLSDKRIVTLNTLSDGFSAFLSVVMDLFIKTDLIREQKNDFGYQPSGIVLIDEPETHLHISMQYNILPLISRLFPNLQFIVATHSPAIISSLENAIVFDLTSKSEVADWILGSSYSELMVGHFGLENEYSPVADRILEEVNNAAKKKDISALKSIYEKNETFLTPALRLDIESLIIKLKNAND
ncbi:MAG: AAA family ATPase [Marinilabiliaceae bacterium]|nr:AAA family ATPase [Marinilabiliaceae bacterium]